VNIVGRSILQFLFVVLDENISYFMLIYKIKLNTTIKSSRET